MNEISFETPATAVIVAGGSGERMGSETPKQFIDLLGKSILNHSIDAFLMAIPNIKIVVVLPQVFCENIDFLNQHFGSASSICVIPGGKNRYESVKNGLQFVEDKDIVFIHDAVRPLVTQNLIRQCYLQAVEKGSAIPAIDLTDSIREIRGEKNRTADRTKYKSVQTPQVFSADILLRAFNQAYLPTFTDEASVVEADGSEVLLIEGEKQNIKITYPEDLLFAKIILKMRLSTEFL